MSKETVKAAFGQNARSYADSVVHAQGASLGRLVELLKPQKDWDAIDVATGAGHMALAVAPFVSHVWATDITPEMLALAGKAATERGLDNITVETADAEELPFPDGRFDLLTCRIAAHHFNDIGAFLTESKRVLRPGGLLGIVDNIVPEGPAGDYVNAFEKLRDGSHVRCLRMDEWLAEMRAAGFSLEAIDSLRKTLSFGFWAKRHGPVMQSYLRAMLDEAGDDAALFLQPEEADGERVFHLMEGLLIGRKPVA